MSEIIFLYIGFFVKPQAFTFYCYFFICTDANLRCQNAAKKSWSPRAKAEKCSVDPCQYPLFRITLCCKIWEMYNNLRQKVVTNCVDRWLLQNAASLITKCATYYKMPQPLLQNTQVITKCRRTLVLASFRFARYTALMSPTEDETAVHGYGLSLSVLVVLMSRKANFST